ncbi:MAG TPA: thrombospondin type 3 repeat-containing protein [Myxococcota bacterium]|jgi:hypothetical protein|nr:thrombospondin type 3 repeat-containing protein [Myxococcota bacterium]
MKLSTILMMSGLGALLVPATAFAQTGTGGECSGTNCGTPQQSGGGGCGCGGGSILVNNTDQGDTYQYADDADSDGFEDGFDNCAFVVNLDQADADGDGIGDACDNCIVSSNAVQGDVDADSIGDACDPDADGDNILNTIDNCMLVPNTSQNDADADLDGDACDTDDDNDGVVDTADNCPLIANPAQDPAEVVPDCDQDTDNDGFADSIDDCTEISNPGQGDADLDGAGDACDSDADGDGIDNVADNCPMAVNLDQEDADRDGFGTACDMTFCYVVDNPGACLDPLQTFTVYATALRDHAVSYRASTGDDLFLQMHANRGMTGIRYTWVVVSRPDGSHATIDSPTGATAFSEPGTYYMYRYDTNHPPLFTPDKPGTYVLRLVADEAFDDTLYPGSTHSESEVMVDVDGPSLKACSVAAVGARDGSLSGLALIVGLVGAVLVARRRVR